MNFHHRDQLQMYEHTIWRLLFPQISIPHDKFASSNFHLHFLFLHLTILRRNDDVYLQITKHWISIESFHWQRLACLTLLKTSQIQIYTSFVTFHGRNSIMQYKIWIKNNSASILSRHLDRKKLWTNANFRWINKTVWTSTLFWVETCENKTKIWRIDKINQIISN